MIPETESRRFCNLARCRRHVIQKASRFVEKNGGRQIKWPDRLNRLTMLSAKGAGSRGRCGQICGWNLFGVGEGGTVKSPF